MRKPSSNISRITAIVVDICDLKEINGSYGHFSGDDAIKTVAKALKDTISFIDREKLYKLAVSIGYSKYHEKYTKSIDDIVHRADEKMYKAKKGKK